MVSILLAHCHCHGSTEMGVCRICCHFFFVSICIFHAKWQQMIAMWKKHHIKWDRRAFEHYFQMQNMFVFHYRIYQFMYRIMKGNTRLLNDTAMVTVRGKINKNCKPGVRIFFFNFVCFNHKIISELFLLDCECTFRMFTRKILSNMNCIASSKLLMKTFVKWHASAPRSVDISKFSFIDFQSSTHFNSGMNYKCNHVNRCISEMYLYLHSALLPVWLFARPHWYR